MRNYLRGVKRRAGQHVIYARICLLSSPLQYQRRIAFFASRFLHGSLRSPYSTGTYTIIPYLFSKMAVEAPLLFTQSLCQTLCTYFLIGFQGNFGLFVTVFWLLGLASNSVAICAGCVVDDVKKAAELTPLIFVPQLLFSGFFVAINAIPVWLRWAQWLCSLKYTLNLLLLIEFNNDVCGARYECSGEERSDELG